MELEGNIMSAGAIPIVQVFRQYSTLFQLKNLHGGQLDPKLEQEWQELTFTLESIFSGMYHPRHGDHAEEKPNRLQLRSQLPIEYLRVPTEVDVLCETPLNFFSGRLQDISTRGAYVHAMVPFPEGSWLRLTFCTFRDEMPLELEGRVAWKNPSGARKNTLLEGAGVQFLNFDDKSRDRLQNYVYELVEDTLTKANLL
ncbi:MAG TPA: PilZ domain-containing protein [Vicinamibacteria bacterium]